MSRCGNIVVVVTILASVGCGDAEQADNSAAHGGEGGVVAGSDDELDVIEFRWSGCMDRSSTSSELLTGRQRDQYVGLQCIAWDASDQERLVIDLMNFTEDRGFPSIPDNLWRGQARQDHQGVLSLTIEWDFEYVNTGGSCLQDFSFAIAGADAQDTLALAIASRSCTGLCEWSHYSLVLPLGEELAGVVCRYVHDVYFLNEEGWLGSLHRSPSDGECDAGLTAAEVESGLVICATECSPGDVECSLPELFTCQEGVCRLSETWE
jgi:hypothetical protein